MIADGGPWPIYHVVGPNACGGVALCTTVLFDRGEGLMNVRSYLLAEGGGDDYRTCSACGERFDAGNFAQLRTYGRVGDPFREKIAMALRRHAHAQARLLDDDSHAFRLIR